MENADNLDKSVLLKKRGWDKDGGGEACTAFLSINCLAPQFLPQPTKTSALPPLFPPFKV